MRTFDLMRGAEKLTLDDAGQVTRGGLPIGQWSTNDQNQIVVTETGGRATTIDVDWRFDKNNHLPLLLSYRGPKPRIMTMTRQAGSGSKPEDIAKAREEAEKKMHAEAPEEVDFYIRMTDHKKVGGLMLPHKLTFLTENEVSEEFEISKYQLNPQFKADRFEKH